MLKKLKVKNFRRLQERSFDLVAGLNVVRGSNEQGKSTMLEAIAYGLMGAKALRTPLAETVTWGQDEKTLRVDLEFQVEGIDYALKRSKSGAECRWTAADGSAQTVVGQNEVTAFVGRLFGVDVSNINRLVLSGQGDIRGALAQGAAKTAELIETLSNFSIIDEVVTRIGERLLTGSVTPFETKIAELTPALEETTAALANVPDTVADEAALALMTAEASKNRDRAEQLLKELSPLSVERKRLEAVMAEHTRLQERVNMQHQQVAKAQQTLAECQAARPPAPDPARLAHVTQMLADVDRFIELKTLRGEVERIPEPAVTWDEGMASFAAEINRVKSRSQTVQRELSELSAQAREQRALRVTATVCGICNQDVSQFPEVAAKNAAIASKLEAIAAQEASLKVELKDLVETLRDLEGVHAEQVKIERLAAKFGDLAAIDQSRVPWRLTWAGPEIAADDSGPALRKEAADLRRQETLLTVWTGKLQAFEQALEAAKVSAEQAEQGLHDPRFAEAEARLPAVVRACDELNQEYGDAAYKAQQLDRDCANLSGAIREKRAIYDAAVARVEGIRTQLETAKASLAEVAFNNELLKRVRAARPVIANKLWSMVLAAVSRSFSQMRGEESVVTKDADGFKVNGQSIESLSGSTLDILGLAIRLALVRTFLPQSPFLILDEPSAACDADRTAAMLGFLVSAGFDQMLVVTHEDTSEQAASSLIEI